MPLMKQETDVVSIALVTMAGMAPCTTANWFVMGPMTSPNSYTKIGVVKKCIFCSIVGWKKLDDDDSWRDIVVRIYQALVTTKTLFSNHSFGLQIAPPTHRARGRPSPYVGIFLTVGAANFYVRPCKKAARPCKRWDDILEVFTTQSMNNAKWWHV